MCSLRIQQDTLYLNMYLSCRIYIVVVSGKTFWNTTGIHQEYTGIQCIVSLAQYIFHHSGSLRFELHRNIYIPSVSCMYLKVYSWCILFCIPECVFLYQQEYKWNILKNTYGIQQRIYIAITIVPILDNECP